MLATGARRTSLGLRVSLCLIVLVVLSTGVSSHTAGADDLTLGEEHQMDLPAHDAFMTTQDALRGNGILFEVDTDSSLVTLWRNPDLPVNFFSSLTGNTPRYRYEIQAVPEGSHRSKIIVNLRGQHMTQDQLAPYMATKRFALFTQVDDLATKFPPPAEAPSAGGVNFVLLPNEDLKGVAQRVTGDPDNWRQIAKDNGIRSPTDVVPFQSVWVRHSLIKQPEPEPPP